MNPNNSSSAPPPGWTEGKHPMGQAPPPPYQDIPNPGMAPPGPAYPPQQGYPSSQYGGQVYAQQPYPMGQAYPAQPGSITVQPAVFVSSGPLVNPVNDYLAYSVFTLLCCCLPLGVAALIYSISAREANHVGDQLTAERSSRTARTLNHVALGLGLGSLILILIFVLVGA